MRSGVEAFAADVEKVCYLFQAASKRSNSTFAAELDSQQTAAMADLVLDRLDELMKQHSGAAGPVQATTPGKKLKKKVGAESPDGSGDGSQDDKQVDIVEDIERWAGWLLPYKHTMSIHVLLFCQSLTHSAFTQLRSSAMWRHCDVRQEMQYCSVTTF